MTSRINKRCNAIRNFSSEKGASIIYVHPNVLKTKWNLTVLELISFNISYFLTKRRIDHFLNISFVSHSLQIISKNPNPRIFTLVHLCNKKFVFLTHLILSSSKTETFCFGLVRRKGRKIKN